MPAPENHLWQDQARQLGGGELVAIIERMGQDIHHIKKSLTAPFPGGDIEGHLRYHQLMIERNNELRRLRVAIQEKTISGLIWAALAFLGLCIYNYFVSGGKPPTLPPLIGH